MLHFMFDKRGVRMQKNRRQQRRHAGYQFNDKPEDELKLLLLLLRSEYFKSRLHAYAAFASNCWQFDCIALNVLKLAENAVHGATLWPVLYMQLFFW